MRQFAKFLVLGIVLSMIFLLPAGAFAAKGPPPVPPGPIPSLSGVIHACFKTHKDNNEKEGQLRVVSDPSLCTSGGKNAETALSWNVQGIQGIQGVAGNDGDDGADSPLIPFVHVVSAGTGNDPGGESDTPESGVINGLAGPHILITGANLHVRSSSGATDDGGGAPIGLGNLIVGYNEVPFSDNAPDPDRNGSHNLVVGPGHNYSKVGGFVAGLNNIVSGDFSSVSGGQKNTASGGGSSVSGGHSNQAGGIFSSVSGGSSNTANCVPPSLACAVSGGGERSATGNNQWVAGSLNEPN